MKAPWRQRPTSKSSAAADSFWLFFRLEKKTWGEKNEGIFEREVFPQRPSNGTECRPTSVFHRVTGFFSRRVGAFCLFLYSVASSFGWSYWNEERPECTGAAAAAEDVIANKSITERACIDSLVWNAVGGPDPTGCALGCASGGPRPSTIIVSTSLLLSVPRRTFAFTLEMQMAPKQPYCFQCGAGLRLVRSTCVRGAGERQRERERGREKESVVLFSFGAPRCCPPPPQQQSETEADGERNKDRNK